MHGIFDAHAFLDSAMVGDHPGRALMLRFARSVALIVVLTATAGRAQQPRHRAILTSFDGLNEARLEEFTDPVSAPTLRNLVRAGACADHVRPAFPSVTPASHAAIWTGAYGNVNGIAARPNGKLPLDSTTILETVDGFSAASLRAEPLWIAAARQGRRVFTHNATQSPQPPAFPTVGNETPSEAAALERERVEAARNVQLPNLASVNGYNRLVSEARTLTSVNAQPRAAAGWRNLARLGEQRRGVEPRELSWPFAGDSLHALFFGEHGYTSVVVSGIRDVSAGVVAHVAPVDTTDPRHRTLARFFSAPLEVALPDGRTYVYVRLFELAPDLSRFMLYISEARVVQGNRPSLTAQYDSAVRGMLGNASDLLMLRGGFGPMLHEGGNGTAEWRYLETVELLTRQFMRGSSWAWHTFDSDLQIEYFPQPDEALHTWLGFADPSTPGVTVRERAAAMLRRAYLYVDLRLAALRDLAREGGGRNTLLVVTADHGFRPVWSVFRPNVALRDAGLLATDSGRVELTRTRAASPNGWWITVNRASRRGGTVPAESVDVVLDRAERALRAARDSSGREIVTSTWRAGPATDSLGIGGPAGGDLYFDLRAGVFPLSDLRGPLFGSGRIQGEHGYPSIDRDMQPLFCVLGPSLVAHRIGDIRTIDIAPTVSDWLRIRPPAQATGRSHLAEVLRSGR